MPFSVFTSVVRIYANSLEKRKHLHVKCIYSHKRLQFHCFWTLNIATVSSCENALYDDYHAIDTSQAYVEVNFFPIVFEYGSVRQLISNKGDRINWNKNLLQHIYTSFIILCCISVRCVRLVINGAWSHFIPFLCVRLISNGAWSHFIPRHKLELIFRGTFCLDPLAFGSSFCDIQSGPLIVTLPSVAYCIKKYNRTVTWQWFQGPYKDSTFIFFLARSNVESGRARGPYKTQHSNKKTRTCIIL